MYYEQIKNLRSAQKSISMELQKRSVPDQGPRRYSIFRSGGFQISTGTGGLWKYMHTSNVDLSEVIFRANGPNISCMWHYETERPQNGLGPSSFAESAH